MNTLTLYQIEKQMTQLSFDEQLWLMERLAYNIRSKSPVKVDDWEYQFTLDPKRFPQKPSGKVSGASLVQIEQTVRYCLGL